MTYTDNQIKRAKASYNAFLKLKSLKDYDLELTSKNVAEQEIQYHNDLVNGINAGDKVLEREWKLFYLKQAVLQDQKLNEQKSKLSANKEASKDVLAYIKGEGLLLKDYYAFLKSNKKYAREFYSKKFTMESANLFINK